MGREIKRVPIDFKWLIKQIWKGYWHPFKAMECKSCDGSGLNPETKKLSDDWYSFDKQDWIDRAVWFTLSQEGVTTYSLPCDIKLWPLVLDSIKRFRKLKIADQNDIINLVKSHSITPLFPVDN